MAQSSIEWTEMTWNPTTGCSKVSSGCKFCYAEVMSNRLYAMGVSKYSENFKVKIHPLELDTPYKWKKPRLVFVNSMSDLFHKDVPDEFIQDVFKVMNDCKSHTFQVLTKRSERLLSLNDTLEWSNNIWMGVSVENYKSVDRIEHLSKTDAFVKFLSCEPLIGPLQSLNLKGIDWVIVGGESGRKPRSMKKEWVIDIKDQCNTSNTKFFFKQWGGTNKKKAGRELDGLTFDDMPQLNHY